MERVSEIFLLISVDFLRLFPHILYKKEIQTLLISSLRKKKWVNLTHLMNLTLAPKKYPHCGVKLTH